jgi:ABC-type bacteriocin/lantibiotic exporter with double-glycine peptidase domain
LTYNIDHKTFGQTHTLGMKLNHGLAGAGGNWPTEEEHEDARVVVQAQLDYCGCACALTIFQELGIAIKHSQDELFDIGGSEMFSGDSLAETMNEVSESSNLGDRWTGQFVAPSPGSDYFDVIRILTERGPWIAHLRERMAKYGHFVVVVAEGDNMICILDPAAPGTSYKMTTETFLGYWTWGAVYINDPE